MSNPVHVTFTLGGRLDAAAERMLLGLLLEAYHVLDEAPHVVADNEDEGTRGELANLTALLEGASSAECHLTLSSTAEDAAEELWELAEAVRGIPGLASRVRVGLDYDSTFEKYLRQSITVKRPDEPQARRHFTGEDGDVELLFAVDEAHDDAQAIQARVAAAIADVTYKVPPLALLRT